jgi:hypothetical protein
MAGQGSAQGKAKGKAWPLMDLWPALPSIDTKWAGD